MKPWEQLRTVGGQLQADPGESVLRDEDFEALRWMLRSLSRSASSSAASTAIRATV
jgi:hypothetical protein